MPWLISTSHRRKKALFIISSGYWENLEGIKKLYSRSRKSAKLSSFNESLSLPTDQLCSLPCLKILTDKIKITRTVIDLREV